MYYLRYYCLFTYIVLFVCLFVCLFCWGFLCLFSSSCVPYATSFYELSVFDCPIGYSLTFKHIRGHVGSGGSQVFNCTFGYSLTFTYIRGHVGSGGSHVFNPVHIDE